MTKQAPGYSLPLPKKIAEAFEKGKDRIRPSNPGLIFERFAPDWLEQPALKREGLETVRRAAERADRDLLQAWNRRWEAMAEAVGAEPFTMQTEGRLIIGLGRKGPFEVGFTFHRYGFPVLPGSSLKGLARTWALVQIAREASATSLSDLEKILAQEGEPGSPAQKAYEEWRNAQPEGVRAVAEDFREIFGTTQRSGRAIFLEGIPKRIPRLELDVMNPHYPDYYRGKAFPTSWQSPTPVYFLAVAAGTRFRFAVGWRGPLDEAGRRLRDLAAEWLRGGLRELGAGAKTSAGYGYFTEPSTPSE
ncbi:MAG: type III-B CRISPR module RAMP protein Cmr6 [Thermoflexus sp.]|uniref:type III-B CRISPR module RAMP protein Cmr6 n=1 Tax=Thermoflexus sp. TaxID=1969742 RepID=UPI0025FD71D6|nr:type III-B CRISPR module RAMP protein Cmr6 [Thermoflexus sp.]MCS6964098.1 type III-B CRISPR module RAMP protein Cmr6 [Thermoflexus sp.]MDW8186233.1 type III-B CRISPR module RAMP protein Cmr6 [Anaerolineae bacterium]